MLKAEGKNWIERFRIKLISLYLLKTCFFSLAAGILLMSFASFFAVNAFLILLVVSLLVFGSIFIFLPQWKLSTLEVANYLNAEFPELEESAALFIKGDDELSLLEKFQIEKIVKIFPISNRLNKPIRKLILSFLLLIISFAVNFYVPKTIQNSSITHHHTLAVKERISPEITDFNLKVIPPSYTGKVMRSQRQFGLKTEVGASVIWHVEANETVKKIQIIFNDKEIVDLDNSGDFTKIIDQSGFYQLMLDGKRSDLYPIEVIPDLPIRIKIINPKPHTSIDIGEVPKVNLSVLLSDDYGINEAHISTTLSSGKGEGVSFTEKKLTFNNDFRGKKGVKLNKLLDLTALNMKPGDELYFFIHATDNHNQTSRSDVYLVSIVDTTELMSMAGMTNGVDLVPEYFRSQRQIIIDTEKLLKDQPTLTTEEFKNRSNALGIDQKLLRLRYGKFLGEESETGSGGDHEGHDEPAYGDVKALIDEYAHKHDIAEDATFFEPELKAQLKAVLNEMWSSELRLRTYKPQEALPFEYKALRLLKDLQQKSRVYVAKTTLKIAKLKLEKRLSGELDKIIQPTQQVDFKNTNKTIEELKILLALLEEVKAGKLFKYGDKELLHSGEKHLIMAAANQPNSYLPALKSLRKLSTSNQLEPSDIIAVQKAIQRLVGVETLKPQTKVAIPETNLYRSYFNHLKNGL
ncbi:hypothetical protein WG904_08130 [Pedobacter sp. Du54]|uniref:hypothetical protein n=1 Tax=Pedobacter anseongensis TaxID=3133439 RepID=UPI00309EAD72